MTWSEAEFEAVSSAEELEIASYRGDGSLRSFVPIWVVSTGGEIYVRSYKGEDGRWFVHARDAGRGKIRAGGVEREVSFEPLEADASEQAALDEDYLEKYRAFPEYVPPVLTETAKLATLRVVA